MADWSVVFAPILEKFKEEYVEADFDERQEILKTLKDEISSDPRYSEPSLGLPTAGIREAIRIYYRDSLTKEDRVKDEAKSKARRAAKAKAEAAAAKAAKAAAPKDSETYAKAFKLNDVVRRIFKQQLIKYDADQGRDRKDRSQIGQYTKNVASWIREVMTESQRKLAEKTLEEWNRDGAPDAEKAFAAEKKLGKRLNQFVGEMERTMGVHVIVLATYRNTKGGVDFGSIETRPKAQRKKFMEQNKAWKKDTARAFLKWAQGEFPNADSEDSGDSDDDVRKEVELELNDEGFPILPPRGDMDLEESKAIIRKFCQKAYEHYTNNKRVKVPWSAIQADSGKFIDDLSLPEDTVLRDPSKLQQSEVKAIWRFWRGRQKNGQLPIVYIGCGKNHMREQAPKRSRKGKGKWVDVTDSEAEESDDEGGDFELGDADDDSGEQEPKVTSRKAKGKEPSRKPAEKKRRRSESKGYFDEESTSEDDEEVARRKKKKASKGPVKTGKKRSRRVEETDEGMEVDELDDDDDIQRPSTSARGAMRIAKKGARKAAKRARDSDGEDEDKADDVEARRPSTSTMGTTSPVSGSGRPTPLILPGSPASVGPKATTSSQWEFVRGLSKVSNFQTLIKVVLAMPLKPEPWEPVSVPWWGSWTAKRVHVPGVVHTPAGFQEAVQKLSEFKFTSRLAGQRVCLAMGLLLRDLRAVIESGEPDVEAPDPIIAESSLSTQHIDVLMDAIRALVSRGREILGESNIMVSDWDPEAGDRQGEDEEGGGGDQAGGATPSGEGNSRNVGDGGNAVEDNQHPEEEVAVGGAERKQVEEGGGGGGGGEGEKQMAEAERQRAEREERQRVEEERQREEVERLRVEGEERQRVEEERERQREEVERQRVEEERQREEAERQRVEGEERLRVEEERRREEERQRAEEEEQQRAEEERRLAEVEEKGKGTEASDKGKRKREENQDEQEGEGDGEGEGVGSESNEEDQLAGDDDNQAVPPGRNNSKPKGSSSARSSRKPRSTAIDSESPSRNTRAQTSRPERQRKKTAKGEAFAETLGRKK
ncbi:hypothetical protein BV22DRAFT_1133619 [Leucogyrophana mollusca]|uniref:Uncharacterized protein n=1 Tax=Leucogyrophana mollusca TaxID=85980 RepID=A0ACB8B2H6_9AGAM|nr:hypothetical protein BV22DRAFT_1133619 [Leucogyrophana mollusca]